MTALATVTMAVRATVFHSGTAVRCRNSSADSWCQPVLGRLQQQEGHGQEQGGGHDGPGQHQPGRGGATQVPAARPAGGGALAPWGSGSQQLGFMEQRDGRGAVAQLGHGQGHGLEVGKRLQGLCRAYPEPSGYS